MRRSCWREEEEEEEEEEGGGTIGYRLMGVGVWERGLNGRLRWMEVGVDLGVGECE